jgi:UDP-N-acetylglucosamine 4,6-dehydratase
MVLTAFQRMHGGELYVKKIPSMRITDLVKVIAPNAKMKEVGIRPGEKIHEQMITKEDARTTLEFDDYYVVLPEIRNEKLCLSYGNCKRVSENFEYSSDSNTDWLTVDQMKKLSEDI